MSTAKAICGELSFEHGFDEPPEELWRLVARTHWGAKTALYREWYASEEGANRRAAHFRDIGEEVLSITQYGRAAK